MPTSPQIQRFSNRIALEGAVMEWVQPRRDQYVAAVLSALPSVVGDICCVAVDDENGISYRVIRFIKKDTGEEAFIILRHFVDAPDTELCWVLRPDRQPEKGIIEMAFPTKEES